jgi:hypothetical protein
MCACLFAEQQQQQQRQQFFFFFKSWDWLCCVFRTRFTV